MRERKRRADSPESKDQNVLFLYILNHWHTWGPRRQRFYKEDYCGKSGVYMLLLFTPAALSFQDLQTWFLYVFSDAFCYPDTHQWHSGTVSLGSTAWNGLEGRYPSGSHCSYSKSAHLTLNYYNILLREYIAMSLKLRTLWYVLLRYWTQIDKFQTKFYSAC